MENLPNVQFLVNRCFKKGQRLGEHPHMDQSVLPRNKHPLPANAKYVVFNDLHDYIEVQGSYNPSTTGTYSRS